MAGLGCKAPPPQTPALAARAGRGRGRGRQDRAGSSPYFCLFSSLRKLGGRGEVSERPSRCSSCKGRSGEKRWCVTVPERRGRGAARAWTWPPVAHGQFRRKRSRQTPVGAALGRLRHLHVPGRRPHLPGRGPAAGHCQPAGHRPAWGPERQALPTMTPARVVPFTSLRKSPLRGVCQKPGSGVIASEEGDILNGGEGKRPPQKKTTH